MDIYIYTLLISIYIIIPDAILLLLHTHIHKIMLRKYVKSCDVFGYIYEFVEGTKTQAV